MCKTGINQSEEREILRLNQVTYVYEGERLPVWEYFSCCFFQGKIHGVCGPSGCGKSTILYLLDGLIPHMYEGKLEGEVRLEGEIINDIPPRYRCGKIGYVMQNPESQFCTFTVEEELAFGMENQGFPVEKMRKKIREILVALGMEGYEKEDLNNLSGGQKQKIAIASVVVTEPEILLLDEPTANLDPRSRRQVFEMIVDLSRRKGMTVILVEHNIDEIIHEVDYLTLLDSQGNRYLWGKRTEVEDRYRHFFRRPEDGQLSGREDKGISSSSAAGEVVLRIRNLHFSYPGSGSSRSAEEREILSGITLDIPKQELTAIIGENGVGKTTLMRLIFRIYTQNEGSIEIFGKRNDEYKKNELYHLIGLVFQNPESQFVANTVYDEMMFSLKRVKISREAKEERIETMLRRFRLAQEKEKSPFVLSQGQKRRLSVASMLLTNQKLLFLDEPTYGQDFDNRRELMRDMQALIREGITIVMITHDLDLVREYATRVIEIDKGKVKNNLPAEDYFARTSGLCHSGDEGGDSDVCVH